VHVSTLCGHAARGRIEAFVEARTFIDGWRSSNESGNANGQQERRVPSSERAIFADVFVRQLVVLLRRAFVRRAEAQEATAVAFFSSEGWTSMFGHGVRSVDFDAVAGDEQASSRGEIAQASHRGGCATISREEAAKGVRRTRGVFVDRKNTDDVFVFSFA